MREASGLRIRLLVELPSTLPRDALVAAARFWLNRGASGIYVAGADGSELTGTRALHSVLRSYLGGRILAGDAIPETSEGGSAAGREGTRAGSAADAPDLLLSSLHGFGGGAQDNRRAGRLADRWTGLAGQVEAQVRLQV